MIHWLRALIGATIARARFERDMRDEVRAHIDHRADDLAASGLARDEAQRLARLEFGPVESYKEQCRDASGFVALRPLHGLGRDFTVAARRLRASPLFLIFAVVSLAAGIAVTTTVYSLLYSVFWKPSGIARPDRVLLVASAVPGSAQWMHAVSPPDFEDLRAGQTAFAVIGAATLFGRGLQSPLGVEMATGEAVTPDYFRTLGLRALHGRLIQPGDEQAHVVVLGESVWRAKFDADPALIGRVVRVGGQPFEVIGIVAFRGLGLASGLSREMWIPIAARAAFAPLRAPERERPTLTVVGRLEDGVTVDRAAQELATMAGRLDSAYPINQRTRDGRAVPGGRGWVARPVEATRSETESRLSWALFAMVCLVLVVACTNLANLVLARGVARARELAVRRALGASRWRLVRELCAEGAIIGLLGGLTGLAITRVLIVLTTVDIPIPRGTFPLQPELNGSALMAATGAVLLSLFVFSLEPALQLTRRVRVGDLGTGLATVGVERSRRQGTLVRAQVAISVSFFLLAAVMVKVIAGYARHDTGIALDQLSLATVHFGLFQNWDEPRGRRSVERALEEMRRQPGITRVAASSGMPFGLTITPTVYVRRPGDTQIGERELPAGHLLASTPDIFETLGVPILHGRGHDDRDDAGAPRVAVVSAQLALALFGSADAVGRDVAFAPFAPSGEPAWQIARVIGVAGDTDTRRPTERRGGVVYLPFAQHYAGDLVFVARTAGSPSTVARQLQLGLLRTDPDLATGAVGPASLLLAGQFVAARIAGSVAGGLALLTLALAMIGLHGVQSLLVNRRTREVGLRMALGAAASQIQWMVLSQGLTPVLQGVAVGLFLGTLVRMALRSFMFSRIQVVDPAALAVVPAVMGLAAFVACYFPARRAARVDPNVALREG